MYLSGTHALALLEVLAGVGSAAALESWVLIGIRFDPALVTTVESDALPSDWRSSPPPPSVQRIGDGWARSRSSALLRVPSVIVPPESNYLLNPLHPDFSRVEIGEPEQIDIDRRIVR